jgi:hypothetical protein
LQVQSPDGRLRLKIPEQIRAWLQSPEFDKITEVVRATGRTPALADYMDFDAAPSQKTRQPEPVAPGLSTILIVLLILLLIGALPSWPYSAEWGYAPGGVLGTVLVVVVILALLGRI